jgi:hypothetical protein
LTASAVDYLGHPLTASCVPASGSTFPLGTTVVTCTATDSQGHSSSASFHVTVVQADRSKPVITVPHDLRVEATDRNGAVVEYTVTVTDPFDAATVSCDPAPGSLFRLGDTHVHCTAVDENGNRAHKDFDVHVDDTTPPAISVPDDISVTTPKKDAAVSYAGPTALDSVDGPVPVHCDPPSGSNFHAGTTTVRCEARDSHGNHATASFTVTVVSTDPGPPRPRTKPGGH